MTAILALTRDFIERMANPAYGGVANEEHSLRFAQSMRDERFRRLFTDEVRSIRIVDTLTSHGWLWLVGWAKANAVEMDVSVLAVVYDEWASVFLKKEIVELALQRSKDDESPRHATIDEYPNDFLRAILTSSVQTRIWEAPADESFPRSLVEEAAIVRRPNTAKAKMTLAALMQSNRRLAHGAAGTLMSHEWEGQKAIVEFFWSLADGVDDETRSNWISAFSPPEPDNRLPRQTARL